LPPPAADLLSTTLPIVTWTDLWLRIHQCRYPARYFDTGTGSRPNATDGAYGVLYAGDTLDTCFVETFLRLDTPQQTTKRSVSEADLRRRCVTAITALRPLRLVDFRGAGLARIGADARLCAGNHSEASPWARALWAHPDQPDGIAYPARHNPQGTSLALFDRADTAVSFSAPVPLAVLPAQVLADILDRYEIDLRP
jgi:hypothetical protein